MAKTELGIECAELELLRKQHVYSLVRSECPGGMSAGNNYDTVYSILAARDGGEYVFLYDVSRIAAYAEWILDQLREHCVELEHVKEVVEDLIG